MGDPDPAPGGDKGRNESDREEKKPKVPALVNGRYKTQREIGSGSYSDVYLGVDTLSGDEVAMKFEWTKADKGARLLYEAKLYQSLPRHQGIPRVPRIFWYGRQAEYNIMVMELLGPSLEDLFRACNRKFSLKTTAMLGEQIVDLLEFVHSQGVLHRDIKPHNFLMGTGERSRHVYVMDFGLAKRYLGEDGAHIVCTKKKGLTGTVRYTTLNVHRGLEPSRRDDLGAVGYVLMHFNLGRLPWQGIDAKSKRVKQRKIGRRKERTPNQELCKSFPQEFALFLDHCDKLEFDQAPDYGYLRKLMRDVCSGLGLEWDLRFDWMNADGSQVELEPKKLKGAGVECRPEEQPAPKRRRHGWDRPGEPDAAAAALEAALEDDEGDYEYEYSSYESYDEEEEEEEEDEEEESEEEEEEEDEKRDVEPLGAAPAAAPGG